MSININDLLMELRAIAPRELEEDWDNGGYQINMGSKVVNRVLVTLEITSGVIREAVEVGADFIVTHHPLFFNKLDVIDGNTVTGSYAINLIKNGITVYTAHTSFDSVFGGNNDYLADLLDLQKVRKLKVWTPLGDKEIIGRMGSFHTPMTLQEAATLVERVLKLPEHVRTVGDKLMRIHTVGLCTGAGGSSIEAVIKNSCDLFITGDVKHNEAQIAKEMGLCVIDAGHFGTESIFVENFAEKLKKATREAVEVLEAKSVVNPFDPVIY